MRDLAGSDARSGGALDPGPSLRAVLVVIPALNEEQHIETCIRSLIGAVPPAAQPDVAVADGGSRDATRAIVQRLAASGFPRLRLVDNPARLQSAGVNEAVRQCATPAHKVMIRCDAHSIYPEGFLTGLLRACRRTGAASVVVPMDAIGQTGFARAAAWVVDTRLGSGGSAHRGGRKSRFVDHGHHALFDLSWFHRTGGYDPAFSHNEDAEYDRRLAQAGGRIWLETGVRIQYVMRPGLAGLARQYRNYGRGRARTVRKHRMRPRLRQLIPAVNLAGMLLCLGAGFLQPLFWLWPAAYALLLTGTGIAGAVRLRGVSGLWAAAALAAMHNAWALGFLGGMLRPRLGPAPAKPAQA